MKPTHHPPRAPGRRRGRPSKLTPAVQEAICRALREGNAEEVSAKLAGVHPATFFRWVQRGAQAAEALQRSETGEMGPDWREPECERDFREFREAVTRAVADSETVLRGFVHACAKGGQTCVETREKRARVEPPEAAPPKARARMVVVERVRITRQREPDWRAAMTLLERRFPERWGRRAYVEVAGEVGGEADVPAGRIVVEDPIARELARRLRDRLLDAGEGDDG